MDHLLHFHVFAALMSLLPRLVWAEETFLRKDDKNDNKLSIYFCDTMARTKLGFKLPENRDGARNYMFIDFSYLFSLHVVVFKSNSKTLK